MSAHYSHLTTIPFIAVSAGKKTIESRLYDKKRQGFAIGDTIVFIHREVPAETITATITNLFVYPTFHDLFTAKIHNPAQFGGESAEQLERQTNSIYPITEQTVHRVIGIEFTLDKDQPSNS